MNDHFTHHYLERMRAIVAQAVAEAISGGEAARIDSVSLVVYGTVAENLTRELFEQAAADTPAEGAAVIIQPVGSRYICWNCCGLRFESDDGICPNCGEDALEVPEEIAFGLSQVKVVRSQ